MTSSVSGSAPPSPSPSASPAVAAPAARVLSLLERTPHWLPALLARIGMAGVFWRSGQTKGDGGLFSVSDSTLFLFAEEYRVPLLPPDVAAYLATYAEHILPVMLILGLGSRLAAAGMLGMTVVIQLFVYPNLWPDHALWAAALVFLIARGPGVVSLDHLIRRRLLGG